MYIEDGKSSYLWLLTLQSLNSQSEARSRVLGIGIYFLMLDRYSFPGFRRNSSSFLRPDLIKVIAIISN